MKKLIFLIVLMILFTSNVEAQYGKPEVLGEVASITVDKKILLKNGQLVDNLGVADYHYSASEEVTYKIKVKNNSGKTLEKISVKDTLPQYLTFVFGPGSYDKKTRILSFKITKLLDGETKEYQIKVKVYASVDLPKDMGVACIVNKVKVQKNNLSDEDTAQICIEKAVIPATGPSTNTAILFASFIMISFGTYLYRKHVKAEIKE